MHLARHPRLRHLIALLMLCALPLHACALYCSAHCALTKAAVQIDTPGHDCGCDDDGARSALCAAAQTVAIAQSATLLALPGGTDSPVWYDGVARSHIPSPPERPPRLG